MGIFSRKQSTETTEQAAIDRLVDTLLGLPRESQMAIARLVERLIPSLAKERDSVEALPWGTVGGAVKEAVLKIAPKLITPERCWSRVKAAWSRRLPEVQGRIRELADATRERDGSTEASGSSAQALQLQDPQP